jgi:hypothetical protein
MDDQRTDLADSRVRLANKIRLTGLRIVWTFAFVVGVASIINGITCGFKPPIVVGVAVCIAFVLTWAKLPSWIERQRKFPTR